MTARIERRRGQPVAALLLVLSGWFAVRAVVWESPFPAPVAAAAKSAKGLIVQDPGVTAGEQPAIAPDPGPAIPPAKEPSEPMWLKLASALPSEEGSAAPALAADRRWRKASVPPHVASGHNFLIAAAFTPADAPRELTAAILRARDDAAPVSPFPSLAGDTSRVAAKRWSGDAWVLARSDTTTPVTSGRGSYGKSQAGAVVRYRLAPDSGHRPAVYARASAALADEAQPEVAVGLTARPVPGVPVAVAAEARVADLHKGTEVRPAVFAYSELPPRELPFGTRAEAYVQGGYVGGHYATAFIDGQVRVDRAVTQVGAATLRAGGGAWGGAQHGVKRLDIGPGATLAVKLGATPLRMSADWRFRVAGRANPGSGPALTVSTGF